VECADYECKIPSVMWNIKSAHRKKWVGVKKETAIQLRKHAIWQLVKKCLRIVCNYKQNAN